VRNTGKYAGAVALGIVASCATVGWAVEQPAVTTVGVLGDAVAITQLAVTDGVVTGTLVNRTGRTLREVKLLVRYAWLWKDERTPRRDNPGRSAYYVVPGEIPPHGSLPFVYRPEPPLPQRTDGRFEPSVEVVGVTEVGDGGA